MNISTRMIGTFLTTLTGLTLLSAQAHADLQFNSSSIVGNIFTYSLNFNNNVDLGTGLPSQRLQAGNFATIYDITAFNSATLDPAFASLFTLTTQPFGITPPGIAPTEDDTINATLTYTGPTTTADQSFMNILQINSISTTTNPNGQYAGETTKNAGIAAGTNVGTIGFVTVPGFPTSGTPADTPEPGTLALFVTAGLSGSAFAFRRRRNRK
ncbi:MAG: sorting protein [Chthonomonadales bacterium]|nr:sorting protein [Chthonomonadales bacterium]